MQSDELYEYHVDCEGYGCEDCEDGLVVHGCPPPEEAQVVALVPISPNGLPAAA